MKQINIISICLLLGLIAGCSQQSRSDFLRDFAINEPLGLPTSKEKRERRKKEEKTEKEINLYKIRGYSDKDARRMATTSVFWGN